MADNVTFQATTLATPPSATEIATDEVSGAHFQRVKLDIGGDGNSSPVTVANPLPVDIVSGSGGGTSSVDDAAFAVGVDSGTPMMGVVTADSVDSGDVGVIGMLANRQQKVTLYDSAGVEVAVSGGTQYAQGTASTDTDTGTAALAVRRDTAAVATGVADGERLLLSTDALGRLRTSSIDVTQPVSAATLPLPSGASTLAEQQTQTTLLTAANTNSGTTADAAATAGGTGTLAAKLRAISRDLVANIVLAAGSAVIGAVTQSGAWVLSAGSAIIGKVGIDQTTPGTTNAVHATNFPTTVDTNDGNSGASTLRTVLATDQPALTTAGLISVKVDQTTPGTTNAVSATNFPATVDTNDGNSGASTIRVVVATDQPALTTAGVLSAKIDQTTPGTTNAVSATNFPSTVDVNDGNSGASTVRVVIATDQPKFTTTSNYPAQAFVGSTSTPISLSTDIAAGAFSGAPASTWQNNDAAVPNAQYALAMAEFPDWAAAPVALTTVDLYVLLKDVDGTDDETDAPSGSAQGGAHWVGSFTIAAADALQRRCIVIDLWAVGLIGSITGDFYIRNNTAQNMNNDGGTSAVLKITPFAIGFVA